MGTKTFNAKEVTLTIGGRVLSSGFADGDFVKVAMDNDDWAAKAGADGEVTRSKVNNPLATGSIFLMQTSDGNDVLSQIRSADLAAPNGAGVGQFLMRDQFGRSVVRGQCWVMKPPDQARGREAGTNEWKIQIVVDEYFAGGSITVGV